MIKTKKVILITKAFLMSAGLENLVLELSGMLVDHIYDGTEKKLAEKLIGKKPEFVIIDPEAVEDTLISLVRELNEESEIKVIGLESSDTADKVLSHFSYSLNINHNKLQLIEALQKIVGKENNSEAENDQAISKRETEILRNLALGLTNQEVADKLFLSVHTVMTHRKKITRKLGIKTISGLTVYALMNNLVDIREVERTI
jgi:DNA-binding NarL/FixJ family response regulator